MVLSQTIQTWPNKIVTSRLTRLYTESISSSKCIVLVFSRYGDGDGSPDIHFIPRACQLLLFSDHYSVHMLT